MSAETIHSCVALTLPCGARAELWFQQTRRYYPQTGDGWNEPRIPSHYEYDDDWVVTGVTLYPIDGGHWDIALPRCSLAWHFFQALLTKRLATQP